MITIETLREEYVLKPTIFNDNTSQVWKLPESILNADFFHVTWNFEAEREIFDLLSFRNLIGYDKPMTLDIPYLPFARQDKNVSNETTFNLHVFANLINDLMCQKVTTVDVHSYEASRLIQHFVDVRPEKFHEFVMKDFNPDYIFLPDNGACIRYSHSIKVLRGNKTRCQSTGEFTSYSIENTYSYPLINKRILIVDDLVDNGGTFILAAKALREHGVSEVGLCVTHAILKSGTKALNDAGINKIYATDSFIKNKEGVIIYECSQL